jgi:hypothetical protein
VIRFSHLYPESCVSGHPNGIYHTRVPIYFKAPERQKKRPFGPPFFSKFKCNFLCNSPFFHPKPPPFFSGFKCNSPKFFPDLSGRDYVNFRPPHAAPPHPKSRTRLKKFGIGPPFVHPDRAISTFPDLSPPYNW